MNANEAQPSPNIQSVRSDEVVIDLRDLFWALVKGSWLIVLLGLVGAYFGVQFLHRAVPLYEAKLVVTPSGDSGDSVDVPSQVGILSGLSLNVGRAGKATLLDRLEYLFSSLEFARIMQDKYGLLQVVYKSAWDPETKTWIAPTGEEFDRDQAVKRYLNQTTWSPPSIAKLAEYLGGTIVVNEPDETPFYEIVVFHQDPEYALFLLQTAYKEADELLRQQDRDQVAERLAYLKGQLETTSLVEIRKMLLGMLGQEVRRGMLLESNLPYAARTIEPARVSAQPIPPNMRLEIGWRAVVGIFAGIVLVLGYYFIRRA
jgi:uncharacterized protein involved in exopolysaccharide biosynthesis